MRFGVNTLWQGSVSQIRRLRLSWRTRAYDFGFDFQFLVIATVALFSRPSKQMMMSRTLAANEWGIGSRILIEVARDAISGSNGASSPFTGH